MTEQVIRIGRPEGYEISPRGAVQFYAQGDYKVPEQMPLDVARRCLESGVGLQVVTPATRKKNIEIKLPTKKKRLKAKTGPKR